ncbi:MAG TPA: hypothetical protein VIK10_12175 [Prolixibacteraceae bacterium]
MVDLYKNYFQDAYGPGHLIPDTIWAGAFLDEELKNAEWKDTLRWQPLGINHDYFRVNLSMVKEGTVPRNVLLEGMSKSVPLARKPDIESWKREWGEVIKATHPGLPNFASDEKAIDETLSKGTVVMHHSKHYERAYQPHYRVIHRTIFESWMEKYIKKDE